MSWPHLMYRGMYKYKPTLYVSLARRNEYEYFIFQVRALNKMHSSLRKINVKYILIQFHFRMAKMYSLCPFSTHIHEEIFRNIDLLKPVK